MGACILPKLKALYQLLRDPAGWSAAHYQKKNRMDYTALHPKRWKKSNNNVSSEAGDADAAFSEDPGDAGSERERGRHRR
jgi:hypothetical protein